MNDNSTIMTERQDFQAQSGNASSSFNSGTSTTSSTFEKADEMLNIVGDKVANATGQHETVQKATTFVEEKVLGVKNEQKEDEDYDLEAVHGYGAAKEHADNAKTEQIEEFMRHQNRSYQG